MSAADRPYTNQSTRRDKAEALKADTYFNRARIGLDLDAPRGRFAVEEKIAGQSKAVEYPKQPASSPWAGDPVGVEPPLGVEINAQEPTGEAHEIEKSLAALPEAPTEAPSPAVVETVTRPTLPKRRKVT